MTEWRLTMATGRNPLSGPDPADSPAVQQESARTERARRRAGPRPDADHRPHRQLRYVLLTALGGAVGTLAREWLTLAVPFSRDEVGWMILAINLSGAFLLGVLLSFLSLRGPDTGRRRTMRLFAGTGVLGGFTTYSALATDGAYLIAQRPLAGIGYALGTVAGGLLTAALGIVAGRLLGARQRTGSA